MSQLRQGKELENRARQLGVDIEGDPRTQSSSGNSPRAPDYVLQQRVGDAERHNRESRLWIVALVSAVSSAFSAAAAIAAVLWAVSRG